MKSQLYLYFIKISVILRKEDVDGVLTVGWGNNITLYTNLRQNWKFTIHTFHNLIVYEAFRSIYIYNKFTHWWLLRKIQAKRVKHRSSNIFHWAWLKISTRNLDEVKTNTIYFLSFSLLSNFTKWLILLKEGQGVFC